MNETKHIIYVQKARLTIVYSTQNTLQVKEYMVATQTLIVLIKIYYDKYENKNSVSIRKIRKQRKHAIDA